MEIIKVRNQVEGGKKAFELFKTSIENGAKIIGFATGSSPITFYNSIVESNIDLSSIISINLDEYIGLDEESNQSYAYFMKHHLFNYKKLKKSYIPNGMAKDIQSEVTRYNNILKKNPIDFQVLGIGSNGHIGFNEPGTNFDSTTHIVNLLPSTIESNARFFDSINQVPKQAISMGIKNIMSAKQIVLLAFGEKKAEAIYKAVYGKVTNNVPGSVLQLHPNVIIIVDEEAGKLI
ncbi:glucosamine-6-phosphate deaminase [Macrococcoides canis]|uniref:Glucosamine-6-phosphate deaminase n=1 Tax=Macrococcoides canis TaxID=1855823 RepID=A0A4R6C4L7_9STAP|nr:glucosamine-6-phosphate deaminase [Macrococcus canis]MEE1106455.1 glucosamine-6-phosphate deaminase [Macrococcus canis]TDM16653.1 glucosamine-6-phosphate deaminase [Macrococcus canis]TDM19793.1 glucosamine-6-phosphate deaminase [Macrococcus canis]TDM22553.1 glucosamine-6-phosphate deaminase [Macrococcus canis]TDM30123.1 glucosamine-6-phosphate deaminase [Macrococcus canis]